MADKSVTFDILARDRASKAFGSATRSSGKLHHALLGIGKVAGKLALAGVLAVGAGVGLLGAQMAGGVKSAIDYAAAQKQTEAVIKSTGGAAHVSVKDVQSYAATLEGVAGVSDDMVISGENLLLTFTSIRNEAGKGNDIFNQATKTSLDLSLALGQDMKSSAIQVGKALNDPIKGVTALQRVGVSFTESQKKQIKTLVDSGHTLQAQKLILAELNKEFGGASKAAGESFAGAMGRAKNALSDVWRSVGFLLLPKLTQLGNWLAGTGVPALQVFFDVLTGQRKISEFSGGMQRVAAVAMTVRNIFFDRVVPAAKALWGGIGRVKDASVSLWGVLRSGYQLILPGLRMVIGNVKAAIDDLRKSGIDWKTLFASLGPVLKVVGGVIIGVVVFAVVMLTTQIRIAAAAFRYVIVPAGKMFSRVFVGVMGAVLHAATVAFGWIPGIGPKLRSAERSFAAFRNNVNNALNGIHSHKTINFTIKVNGRTASVTQIGNAFNIKSGGHTVQALAGGGRLRAGETALIGEAGPELWRPDSAGQVIPLTPSGGGRGGGGTANLQVNVTQPLASERDIAVAVVRALSSPSNSVTLKSLARALGVA